MELRQASIEACDPGQGRQHSAAIHFKLPVGKSVIGQGVHRQKGTESLAIGVGVLETIGQTCAQDRISAQQLRRINFLEDEIKLEMVSRSGDQTIVYAYPLEE
jgi:hypothetical protein